MKKRLTITAMATLALLIAAGCTSKDDGKAKSSGPQATVVSVEPVLTQPLDVLLTAFGTLKGDEEIAIAAKVGGRITAVKADVGDRLDFGGLLAQIDPMDYEIALEQAKASLNEAMARLGLETFPDSFGDGESFDVESVPAVVRAREQSKNADASYARHLELFNDKPPLISAQTLADIKTAAESAKSAYRAEQLAARALFADASSRRLAVDARRRDLAESSVRTPTRAQAAAQAGVHLDDVGGDLARYVVAQRMVSVGEHVTPGQTIFRVVADSTVKAIVGVPERHFGQIKLGMDASVFTESGVGTHRGTVRRVGQSVNEATRMFEVEVAVSNPTRALTPGSFVRAEIAVGHDPAAVFAPVESVITYIGVRKVFTISEGKAKEHIIEIGTRRGSHVHIVSGLTAPAQVITTGGSKLNNGVPVALKSPVPVQGSLPTMSSSPTGDTK